MILGSETIAYLITYTAIRIINIAIFFLISKFNLKHSELIETSCKFDILLDGVLTFYIQMDFPLNIDVTQHVFPTL